MTLPLSGSEQIDELLDTLLIVLIGEVRTMTATSVVSAIFDDAVAASGEDAGPSRA